MAQSQFLATPDLSLFFEAPADRVMVRRSFCLWQAGAQVRGSIAWGKPDEHDVQEMCEVFDAYARSPFAAQPSLMDVRTVESVSVTAFDRLARTLAERRSEWQGRVGRQAILHGGGFASALILGALQLVARGYELQAFEDAPSAFAWLGAPSVALDFETLRASLIEEPDVVRRVRAVLDEAATPLSVRALARKVGLSPRSLQRHLASAGTSVRTLRMEHLLGRAERLLEGTELDLTAIAAAIGLHSPAQLVALFRVARNTTPGAWRHARRGAAGA